MDFDYPPKRLLPEYLTEEVDQRETHEEFVVDVKLALGHDYIEHVEAILSLQGVELGTDCEDSEEV